MESVVRKFPALRSFPVRILVPVLLLAAWLSATCSPVQAAIEATRGKTYRLSGKHGPWMIMVTSLSGETSEQEKNAEKAANEVVYQLRRKGIPAYVYSLEDQYEEVAGYDRQGRSTKRKYKSQNGMIGIVAGNYDEVDGRDAQQTLKFIKKFEPRVKVNGPDGKPMEVPLSLGKAFLARNPLQSAEELAQKIRDPLLLKLNSKSDYSLSQNKGKYTLVVASFYGNSQVKPAKASFDSFVEGQNRGTNISLENAAEESELLCRTMRAQRNLDAYVWHERFRSIVTVGSFKSQNDPEIRKLYEQFRAKEKVVDDRIGTTALLAESFQIPGRNTGDRPLRAWTMDPQPTVMEVPR